jgi:hypothetical protein
MSLTVDAPTKVRRIAERRGYALRKSKSRDQLAVGYGLFSVTDLRTGENVNPKIAGKWECSWTLSDVEKFLGLDA